MKPKRPKRPKLRKSKKKTSPPKNKKTSPAYSVNSGIVTMRDVGRALGVSHVTVSLALRNCPRIPQARCRQIQKKAEEMGYRMNAAAAALAVYRQSIKVRPVASVLAWLNFWEDPKALYRYAEFQGYWKGASATADKFGYRLDEFVCNGKTSDLVRLKEILLARGISGCLLPPQRSEIPIEDFAWDSFSTVRLGRSSHAPHLQVVASDHMNGSALAFNEVRRLGYNRIGFVTGGFAHQCRVPYVAGYLLAQQSVPAKSRLPLLTLRETSDEESCEMLARWIKFHQPDAILSNISALRGFLQQIGCRVPDDIGLAAMSILDGNCNAGIDQKPEEIGRVATLMLISLLHDNERGVPKICRQTLVEGTWVHGSMMPSRT